jgi:hypothetical protein
MRAPDLDGPYTESNFTNASVLLDEGGDKGLQGNGDNEAGHSLHEGRERARRM